MSLFNVTKKADYGLLMLAALAQKGRGQTVSIRELVETYGLPKAFTAQIGKALVEAGIVGSQEGRHGGYFLLYDPSEVEVKEALEAIEGEVSPVVCVTQPGVCPVESYCSQRSFMSRFTAQVEKMLSDYTLADLIS